jgi:hypothetical protein
MRADQAGQAGVAHLLREMMQGDLALAFVSDRNAAIDDADLIQAWRETVLIIGDDDHASTGPAGWRCAADVASWCAAAVIHAAGATAESYGEAARAARSVGRTVLVETDVRNAQGWAGLFMGKPRLLILPRDGIHPIQPKREEIN